MKKRIFMFSILLTFINSCEKIRNIVSAATKDETTAKNGKMSFSVVNDKMIITSLISSQKVDLIFDTGASNHSLNDSSLFVKDENNQRLKMKTSAKTADGEVKTYIGNINIETNIVSGKNSVASYLPFDFGFCRNYKGLFSPGYIMDSEKQMFLNFAENYVEVGDNFDLKSFEEIPMRKKFSGLIEIKMKVDNKENWYAFDTGADTPFIQKFENKKYKNDNYIALGGLSTIKLGKKIPNRNISFYRDVPVMLNNNVYYSDISNENEFISANLGLRFIKNFNWIFDFKNNKLYFKKLNTSKIIEPRADINYGAKDIDNKLVVFLKKPNQNLFNLGDVITSYNNKPITIDNICEVKNELNTIYNWENLNLKILK
mgnify:CR=1 FL=1